MKKNGRSPAWPPGLWVPQLKKEAECKAKARQTLKMLGVITESKALRLLKGPKK